MSRILLVAVLGLGMHLMSGTDAVAGGFFKSHGYGHGYYANHAQSPGASTIAYYGHGYWYRTPYYSKGVLSDYYHYHGYQGGYRPGYSHGVYQQPVQGGYGIPYEYSPRPTEVPSTIVPTTTSP